MTNQNPGYIVPPREAIGDVRGDGSIIVRRSWWRYFQNMFVASGGGQLPIPLVDFEDFTATQLNRSPVPARVASELSPRVPDLSPLWRAIGQLEKVVLGTRQALIPAPIRFLNISGGALNQPHVVVGSATLVGGTVTITLSGSALFTSATSYVVFVNDASGAAEACSAQNVNGSSFTIFGNGTDTVSFIAIGS